MLCRDECPRGTKCKPLSNIVTEDGNDFVCVGLHGEKKEEYEQDRFRHCFKSSGGTDSTYDYDAYDLKSVISVMADAVLIDEMETQNHK